jgi:hypothetical protein
VDCGGVLPGVAGGGITCPGRPGGGVVGLLGGPLVASFVMEGSVQGSSDRIRVNAQLIETSTYRWAERFATSRALTFRRQLLDPRA